MGPYGADRAVHSIEFTDCENGLGKCHLTYSCHCTFVIQGAYYRKFLILSLNLTYDVLN